MWGFNRFSFEKLFGRKDPTEHGFFSSSHSIKFQFPFCKAASIYVSFNLLFHSADGDVNQLRNWKLFLCVGKLSFATRIQLPDFGWSAPWIISDIHQLNGRNNRLIFYLSADGFLPLDTIWPCVRSRSVALEATRANNEHLDFWQHR